MANNINPWKYVDAGDISNNPYFKKIEHKDEETQKSLKPDSEDIQKISGEYILTEFYDRYELGVEDIRLIPISGSYNQPIFTKTDGKKIYRPLTTAESLDVMVNDFNTLKDSNGASRSDDDRLKLFSIYKDTCTGIAYKADGTEIKIIPQSDDLILIDKNLNKPFISITDYNNVAGLKLNAYAAIYNKPLSKSEVINHPAWIASVGNTTQGIEILKAYTEIVFNYLKTKKKTNEGMGFYINKSPRRDELRALYVDSIGYDSNAGGLNDLDDGARFLLVAPHKKI